MDTNIFLFFEKHQGALPLYEKLEEAIQREIDNVTVLEEANQLPRCKHSSTVLGSYVAAHSTCLSLLLPQARKRGMKVCLSLFYI